MRYTLSAIKVLFFTLFILSAQTVFSQSLTDEEIKKNITSIDEPLKNITSLEPRKFEYNTGDYSHLKLPKGAHYGFITEEFQQVFPAMINKTQYSYMEGKNFYKKATVKSVDMEELIPVLVAAVKEQQTQIEQLKAEIKELKQNSNSNNSTSFKK